MANEITTQQTSLTGLNLYAFLDYLGQRWNTSTLAFENVTAANWASYAIAMTEAAGTGFFTANQPAGIPAGTPLSATIFQRTGSTPATTDREVASGPIGGSLLANGSVDVPTLTPTLAAILLRAYLVSTGSTTPATADLWHVAGLYGGVAYYQGMATGTYAWTDGAYWYLTGTAPGVAAPSSYFKTSSSGETVTGPYVAAGSALGVPVVAAHGNAVRSGFDPDAPQVVAVGANEDKTGYSLAGSEVTAIQAGLASSSALATLAALVASNLLPTGAVMDGSTGAAVIVSGLPSGRSFKGQHLLHVPSGEARTIATQSYAGGNYAFGFTGATGTEAGPFSVIVNGDVVAPCP